MRLIQKPLSCDPRKIHKNLSNYITGQGKRGHLMDQLYLVCQDVYQLITIILEGAKEISEGSSSGKKFKHLAQCQRHRLTGCRKTESMTTILKNCFGSPMLLEKKKKKKKKEQESNQITLKKNFFFFFLYLKQFGRDKFKATNV